MSSDFFSLTALLPVTLLCASLCARGANVVDSEASIWDHSISAKSGPGYKDNVLLSNFRKEPSGFYGNQIDYFAFRIPPEGLQLTFFADYEDKRYFSSEFVDKEQTFLSQIELKQSLAGHTDLGFTAQYFYQNQVLDASLTESQFGTLPVKGHGISAGPVFGYDFLDNWRLEIRPQVLRQLFNAPLDDYWQTGLKMVVKKKWTRSEIALNYEPRIRFYDTRRQTDQEGIGIRDTHLNFLAHDISLAGKHYWATNKQWQSTLKIGFVRNLDNGAGYFDYHRYYVANSLRFAKSGWEIQAGAKFYYYDYDLQTAFIPSSPLVRRKELDLSASIQRRIYQRWHLFLEYENIRSISTETADSYEANTLWGGVFWNW